jgi:hemerythrin
MLNNRQISEQYEVQINTLYNWQKTKPKLYNYLQNADYNKERNHEINILLSEYSKDIKKDFTLEEIEYIIDSSFQLVSIEEVKSFHKVFIEKEYKNIPSKSDLILSIYDKILELNIIEKYILYKKIHKVRSKDNITISDYPELFKEFICQ